MFGIYPYTQPIILTDDIFVSYGGLTGTSSQLQRDAAYVMAEEQASRYIGSFLLPTVITGQYPLPILGKPIILQHCYINSVDSVKFISIQGCECDLLESDGCAVVYENTYGSIFVHSSISQCGCSESYPYSVQVVYNAGLSSGTSYSPIVLSALTMAAQINLNEIHDSYANESVGDVGIVEFSNQSYREVRVPLERTSFGTSAKANKVAHLLKSLRRRKVLSIG